MGCFKKVLKWFINIFTSILLILLALVIYGKATTVFGNRLYPNYFGYTFFSIASGSMEPTLYVNDVILVKINNDNIKEGDIISYSNNKEIITHRVISINNNSITVKGDNNNTIDEPIDKSQVIGKVIKTYPKLSIWQKVITEPKILILIFVTFLLFDAAISYKGKDNKEVKKTKKTEVIEKKEEKVIDLPKEEPIKVEEIRAKDTDEKKEALLEATVVLDSNELLELCKAKEEKIENEDEEVIEEEPSKYTVRLDLNEINKKIKSRVR